MKTHAILAALSAVLCCSYAFAATPRTLEVLSMDTPPFPYQLTLRGVMTGESEAVVSIRPDGRIADWLVTAYTDPAFERSTGEILETLVCKFPSSTTDQRPARITLIFYFETTGVVVSHTVNDTMATLMTRVTGTARIDKLGTQRHLDQTLAPRHTVAPRYSSGPDQYGSRVTLEFLIDETGRVRMPVLHKGENWPFADAAASALLDWQFEPPTRAGKPVIVAARQEFVLQAQP
jgi:hypothetical protein